MNAIELLQSKQLKKTAKRILLLTILQQKGTALTENDFKNEMGKLYDRITFYRTTQTLIEAGLIHRITIDNKIIKYTLSHDCLHHKNQIHVFCEKCKSVTCLEETILPKYNLPQGFQVEEYELLLRGICNDCSKL